MTGGGRAGEGITSRSRYATEIVELAPVGRPLTSTEVLTAGLQPKSNLLWCTHRMEVFRLSLAQAQQSFGRCPTRLNDVYSLMFPLAGPTVSHPQVRRRENLHPCCGNSSLRGARYASYGDIFSTLSRLFVPRDAPLRPTHPHRFNVPLTPLILTTSRRSKKHHGLEPQFRSHDAYGSRLYSPRRDHPLDRHFYGGTGGGSIPRENLALAGDVRVYTPPGVD